MSFNTQEFVDFLNRADQGLKDLEKKLASGDTKTVIPSLVQTNLMNESFVKIRRRSISYNYKMMNIVEIERGDYGHSFPCNGETYLPFDSLF